MAKGPPPYLVRRFLLDPAVIVVTALLLLTVPLWLLVAAFASRFVPGRWRPFRVAWFLFVYLFYESLMLIVMFVLWVASGFGWKLKSPTFVDIHYAVAGWWLRRVMGTARFTFRLKIEGDLPPAHLADGRPLLVFSRHAGPGDSFLLVDGLLNSQSRRPRIILKDLLKFDPCVDVVLGRLPNRFIPSKGRAGSAVVDSIAELSGGLGPRDALVLFPEGGNFTPGRRERAIQKLEDIGRPGLADQAREMKHVLPPKPTGALTAIEAAPDAAVAFVGHTGLEHLVTPRDLWRGIPMDSHVLAKVWTIPPGEIPSEPEREQWLYDQWLQIDEWIDENFIDDPTLKTTSKRSDDRDETGN
ncbi:MAG: 1-acyl-sn-glycerol-3-phosphate acyltransferase [Acidimicrobiales bacterium]